MDEKERRDHGGNSRTRHFRRRVLAIAANLAPDPPEAPEREIPVRAAAAERIRSDDSALHGRAGLPPALRSCPHCGGQLTKAQLKWALVDRFERAKAATSKEALELMRRLFPEDNATRLVTNRPR